MYFAMDEIGTENTETIKTITSEEGRWRFLYDTAKSYGFDGIHLTPSLYEKSFGLDLAEIPHYFQDFKLTLHFGGLYKVTTKAEAEQFDTALARGFEIAIKNGMHDISIHPPDCYNLSSDEREACLAFFHQAVERWLCVALQSNLTLSLETHVTGKYFLFDGLEAYLAFVAQHPNLGVLVDVSHNYHDGYSEDAIIHHLADQNVTCLHISDALQGVAEKQGTHLAIGRGTIDFSKIQRGFAHIPNTYAALEVQAKNAELANSLSMLRQA